MLSQEGLDSERPGIESWLARHPEHPQARASWADTLILAAEAREINRQNGELITIRMQHNSRALEVLQGAARGLDLYGPDGQFAQPGKRRINDAV